MTEPTRKILALTAQIVIAHVRGNRVSRGELPDMMIHVSRLLTALYLDKGIATALAAGLGRPRPAVPVEQSVTPDYIISLEDGRRFRSLTRHLKAQYGLTPVGYRTRWNLPPDYPMVAANYSRLRARIAKEARKRQLRRHSNYNEED